MTIFLPLNGPNDRGAKPKAPSRTGWESPGYTGINPKTYRGWFGMRCDGLIVVDCDSDEAAEAWTNIVGLEFAGRVANNTWTRRTPHGWHYIYLWHDPLNEGDELLGPHAGVLPGVDLRQGRTSQIVYSGGCGRAECNCDGTYETVRGSVNTTPEFDFRWAKDFVLRKSATGNDEVWDEMPAGIGNITLAAIGGTMRKQGMSLPTMVKCLVAINKITMTQAPMPIEMVINIARSVSRYEIDPFVTELSYQDD